MPSTIAESPNAKPAVNSEIELPVKKRGRKPKKRVIEEQPSSGSAPKPKRGRPSLRSKSSNPPPKSADSSKTSDVKPPVAGKKRGQKQPEMPSSNPNNTTNSKLEKPEKSAESEQITEQQVNTYFAAKAQKVVNVLGDGNCLFRAISQQLHGNQRQHKFYRKKAAEYALLNEEKFFEFYDEAAENIGNISKWFMISLSNC